MGGNSSKGEGSEKKIDAATKARTKSRRAGINAGSLDPDAALNFVKKVIEKSQASRDSITTTLKENVLFSHLDANELTDIVDCMFETTVKAGENVITQGEDGDNFYVMHEGSAEVIVDGKVVHEYKDGKGSFGELALIYGSPRAATIKASVDMSLYAMDRDTYRYLLMGSVINKRKLYEDVLAKVSMLSSCEFYERSQVADALESIVFEDGAKILTQGDPGDDFFIIVQGDVKVTIDDVEVNTLTVADYFGEIALLNNEPRKATVTAVGSVTVGKLDRDRFERVLGPVEDILRRNMDNYKTVTGTQ
eukprot:m.260408 g.260408  ORF g.260408 m.260408 type:complete len:306 (-) comp39835_c0_seq1:274-1191(-)